MRYAEFFPSLDHVNDGIILYSSEKEYIYSNASARKILALSNKSTGETEAKSQVSSSYMLTHEEESYLDATLAPLLDAHIAALEDPSITRIDSSLTTEGEVVLRRFNQQAFSARVHTTTLTGQTAKARGFAITILDLTTKNHIQDIFQQSKRLEVFALNALSIGVSVLQTTSSGILISPLLRMNEYIDKQPSICRMSTALTTLTECFDFLITAETSIKVQIKEDGDIAMREAHFLQLASYMTLHAARFVGNGGEISLSTSTSGPGIYFYIDAESRSFTPETLQDPSTVLLLEEISIPDSNSDGDNMFSHAPTGLYAAQKIAAQYRTKVEYQQRENGLKMRVEIPRSRASQGDTT